MLLTKRTNKMVRQHNEQHVRYDAIRVTFKGEERGNFPPSKIPLPFQIESEWLGREGGFSPFQIYF